jgi:hypothetical protein
MQAHGPFCHLCERRLNAGGRLWQSERDFFFEEDRTTADDWPQLLLLCHDCARAHASAPPREPGARLLLPHRAVTFSLNPNSSFRYHLDQVELVLVDDASAPVAPAATIPAAIVSGATPEAQNTVEHFALNTRYYDASRHRLTVPVAHWRSQDFDRRMHARTQVWQTAEKMARQLAPMELTGRPVDFIRYGADTSGFWSVWLTVFDDAFRDRALAAEIFTPGLADGLPAPVNHHHTGTHAAYLLPPPDATPANLDLS